ncbi:hypothetical protein SPHINGOT1_620004 [Sphingomonas sp. T1]|nr:hypothetical protein SPHINGOT1_620004 [Sphingomonas sp. T1]
MMPKAARNEGGSAIGRFHLTFSRRVLGVLLTLKESVKYESLSRLSRKKWPFPPLGSMGCISRRWVKTRDSVCENTIARCVKTRIKGV